MPESAVSLIYAVNKDSLFFRRLQKRLQGLGRVDRRYLEAVMAAVWEGLAGRGQFIPIPGGKAQTG